MQPPLQNSSSPKSYADLVLPSTLVSDRGTHFINEMVEEVTKKLDIRHDRTTAYNPQCNGQVESTNKILGRILRTTVSQHKRDWEDKLPAALWAYNTTFKEATGLPLSH